MFDITVVASFAKREFLTSLSNYFIFILMFLFFVLNFFLLYFSDVFYMQADELDVRMVLLSIIHLQMYFVPLFSLILSYDSILKEREFGLLNLFLSYPFQYIQVLYGKIIGYWIIIFFSFFIGFIPVCIFLFDFIVNFKVIFYFIFLCMWLSIIFIMFGVFISLFFKNRTFVILINIVCWIFFVFFYDFSFIVFLILNDSNISINTMNYLLLLNPVEVFKLNSVLLFLPEALVEIFGFNITNEICFFSLFVLFFWLLLPLVLLTKMCSVFNKKNWYVQ